MLSAIQERKRRKAVTPGSAVLSVATHERESAVGRWQPAVDNVVVQRTLDKLIAIRIPRRGLREGGLQQAASLGGLPRGKHRENAARSVDELHVGDQRTQLLDRFAIEQCVAGYDDHHVIFARGKIVRETCSKCLNAD